MHKIMNAIPGRGGLRIMVLMLAAVGWLAGCAADEQADVATSPAAAELPDWIERVHPAPGSGSSAAPRSRSPPAPVELDPGTHQATALRVRLNRIGKPHEVLDSFRWEFAIQ